MTVVEKPRSPARGLEDEEAPAPPGAPGDRRLPYLDGLRAVAVLAVLLYHGGVSLTGGGLLGVDVFFVLSGYLITTLLCREYVARATIALGRFWAARARRLLPALFVLLLGVALYAFAFSGTLDLSSVRGDALATLFYVSNWHFIVSDQGYFAQAAAPSPLLHTWSLAVEEQYYLVWPVVALLVLRRGGRRALAKVAAGGALASAALMASLYLAGASTDRLYYGTDTRAQALLVGSVLGVVASRHGSAVVGSRWAKTPAGQRAGAAVGLAGAAFLLLAFWRLSGQSPLLYEGGFLAVSVAAGAVITSVTSWPRGALARGLSRRPLVALGRISYGVYLYHWPIFLALDHQRSGLDGLGLLLARLAATLVVAALSWRFVEEPVRRRRWPTGRWSAVALMGSVAGALGALVAATVAPVSGGATVAGLSALQARAALGPSEVAELSAAGAFGPHPERFLLFGDSQAITMDIGLHHDSVPRYGVRIYGGGWFGCDFDAGRPILAGGQVLVPQSGDSPSCLGWRHSWAHMVARVDPQVVGILMGRFELYDHYFRGAWRHVGERLWDAHLATELNQAVALASARGAKVVLFTAPFDDPSTEQANGQPFPENDPGRVVAYNRLIRQVAAGHPGTVTVIDLNALLDPHGAYTPTIDGIRVRWTDGIHISRAGGEWLQPRILPTVDRLALDGRAPPVEAR